MDVHITGSGGFVGKNLTPYLNKRNFRTLSIDREELQSGDVRLNKNSSVIHLAGKAHDLRKSPNAEEYYDVNFELTKRLYDIFLKSDAKKFIFISSVKAAADSIENILIEECVAHPHTHYGKSKLMAEEYIQSQRLPPDKSFYILRPCMIHGPGNKGNLNLLYQVVKRGIPYPLAGFTNKRSFLSIENMCFLINELLLNDQIAPGIYNIADDEALSTNEVVSILSSSLGQSARLWPISPGLIKFIAKIGDKLGLPLTTERLNKLTESYVVSNDKIKNAIHKPLPVSTSEGLRLTAISFQ